MFSNILTTINWVDILVVCIMGRIIFIGLKSGFITELFKLGGVLLATFVALHFCGRLGEIFHKHLWVPSGAQSVVAFIVLWSLIVLAFKFLRDGSLAVIKMEAQPTIDKWGAAIIATFRGFLICSLVFICLVLTGNKYMSKKVRHSFTGFYLVDLAPSIYNAVFDGFIGKLFPREEKNKELLSLKDIDLKEKKK